jgi:transcriptional regulator with XRE-family HTH domain
MTDGIPQLEGRLIRVERARRGWSQDRLVRELGRTARRLGEDEIGATASMVSRWENGKSSPGERYQRLLQRTFTDSLGLADDSWEDDMHRRAFLTNAAVAGLALLGVAPGDEPWQRLGAALRRPQRTDSRTVDDLEAVTVSFQELYQRVSPYAVLAPARSHLATLTQLLEAGGHSDGTRRRLASLAGETAILMGWLTADDGEHATAQGYYQAALDAAREAGDSALGAYAVGSASTLPAFRASPDHTLYLLAEGRYGFRAAHATPSTRAWLAALEADAHAKAGREAEARRALDRAAQALDGAMAQDARPRVQFFDAVRLAGERGVISVRLGAADEGRRALDEALRELGPGLKIESRLLTSLARAHVRQGDVDRACHVAVESLAIARASETSPSLRDVQALRDELAPWDGCAAVRELDAALAT